MRWLRPSIRDNERILDELAARREQLPPLTPGRHGESLGFHSRFQENTTDPLDILIDLGTEQTIDRIAIFPVSTIFQGQNIHGYGFPRRFVLEASREADFASSITIYTSTLTDQAASGQYPVQVTLDSLTARFLRMRVQEHWKRTDDKILTALSEVMVLSGVRNVAIGGNVKADSFTSLPDWSSGNLIDGKTHLGLPVSPEPSATNGYLSMPAQSPDETKWIQIELPEQVILNEVRLIPTQPLDAPSQYGHGFPRRFRVLSSIDGDWSRGRVIADQSAKAFPNPGDNPVILPGDGKPARFVLVEAEELWHITNEVFALALSELQVYGNGDNAAIGAKVSALDIGGFRPPYNQYWNPQFLVDGYSSQNRLIELDEWLQGLDERQLLDQRIRKLERKNQRTAEATMAGILVTGGGLLVVLSTLIIYNRSRRRRMLIGKQRELRKRIARDLHDDLGSRLGGMRLISESILHDPALPETMQEDIDIIYRASGEASDAMRDIVWLLDSRETSRANLIRHMRELIGSVLGKIECNFDSGDVPEQQLDFEFRRQVLFSFKECLGNIAKHAEATEVWCRIGGDEKQFSFSVRDNGKGFNVADATTGYGLDNLQARAAGIGGSITFESDPGRGTHVVLKTPVKLRK